MKLVSREFFLENRDNIFKRWITLFWDKFEESKAYLIKGGSDPFQNPFAYQVEEAFRKILDFFCEELDFESLDPYLERLAQLRATQENTLSLALNFLIDLKSLLRETWGEEIVQRYGLYALLEIEDVISALLLRLADYYVRYKERLYDLKVDEWKRHHYLLLKRAGLIESSSKGKTSIEERCI
ncbi:MAG: RsbRD N-terminal domain-containing protein [Caldimicrobium sp.]|nr:RsbRD N-terminal domain-containing protein [Caldimicrobium sp.]MCX7873708.1 RsbRD N-terminal domain-containing protein [Caldimicrobium sp.]MDW8093632.1 RsbRD N-terminal domain-containing protein [Caldimicrobium sp.]